MLVSCSDDKRAELLDFFKQNALRLSHHRFHVVGSFLHRQISDLLAQYRPTPPVCIDSLLDIVPAIKSEKVNAWIFFWQPRAASLVLSEVCGLTTIAVLQRRVTFAAGVELGHVGPHDCRLQLCVGFCVLVHARFELLLLLLMLLWCFMWQ